MKTKNKIDKRKTKINILFAFLILSFVWKRIVLDNIIVNNLVFENKEYYIQTVVPALFLIFIILEFYLFACLAIYLIEKKGKTVLSFSGLKRFLKITKTKINILFTFLVLSFIWKIMIAILYGKIINRIGFENVEYYMDYILPIPFYILFILKFYLFTCVVVYLVEKRKKQT